jgi:hypothetical protein
MTVAFLCALIIAQLMLTVPGGRVTFYVLIAAVCVLFALSRWLAVRIWAVVATVCALGFIAYDHEAGQRWHTKKFLSVTRRAAPETPPDKEPPQKPE